MLEGMVNELRPLPKVDGGPASGWQRALLDEVADRGSGHTPDQAKPEYWNGGIKWVSLADSGRLDQGYIDQTEKEISALGIRHSSAVLHDPDTVIVSRDAGVGKSAILKHQMAVSQHFIAWNCRTKNIIDPWFLYSWLQLHKSFFERMAVGSTIKTIGLPLFRRLTIDFPILPEQRKIADILRTWDEAIEACERLIASKQRRIVAARQRLFDPTRPGAHPGAAASWDETTLGAIFAEVGEPNPGLGPDAVITVGKYAIRRQVEHFTRSVASANLANYQLLTPGDFVYDPMSAYYGAIGRYSGAALGIVSPAYTVIRLADGINPGFVEALLKSHYIAFELENRSSQGNREGKRRILRSDEFSSIPFMLPTRKEQDHIANILGDVAPDLELTIKARDALAKQKRGLMQKLLTGEWRVKVDKEAAA